MLTYNAVMLSIFMTANGLALGGGLPGGGNAGSGSAGGSSLGEGCRRW